MKFYNLTLLSIFIINLVFAVPVKRKQTETEDAIYYESKHKSILDKYSSECTLFLRRNDDFPLTKSERKIYLYGNGVRGTIKGGTGSGNVNSRSFITIEEAFEKDGFKILSKKFLDKYDKAYNEAKVEFEENLKTNKVEGSMDVVMPEPEYDISYTKKGDVAIFVLSRNSGEGSDREAIKGDVYLTNTEKKMIKKLAKGFKKFMLVLNTGGPVDLSGLDSVKNILLLSQLGVSTSETLVEIVKGNKYPSGKLATTWTKFEDYQTIGTFGDKSDADYKEGIYVGYRYFDTLNKDVMFPFGFGLGYTDFNFDVKSVKLSGEKFEVKASVKNIGKFKGKEVMELYLSKPSTKLDEPYQILVGFTKTKELKPNKKTDVKLSFKLSDFASYDAKSHRYILDKGSYVVRIGNSSRNTKPCGVITIKSRINVRKVQNKLGKPGFKDFVPETKRKKENLNNVPKFTLKSSSIKEKIINYNVKDKISKKVKSLSLDEKIKLVIGHFEEGEDGMSMIGNSSSTVAGAAAETAHVANLKPVVFADGPAGLRIDNDYYIDENGNAHSADGSEDKNVKIYHQYTTPIPIGTALAQSWNKKFAEICGDIIGKEMELYNVDILLAPALNIHRNILCGRNFEYYSEDPLITGYIASSVTSGVQKHKNKFVTIKHYSANNQEYNRYLNSSNASERALREIYLKGFEICIRESNPGAAMTSHNLINGVHTNESKEITSDILRKEFGFKGIVMTDWVFHMTPGKYSSPEKYRIIKATGDIILPGSKDDYTNIKEALENKNLTMSELEISATRIYNLSKKIKN